MCASASESGGVMRDPGLKVVICSALWHAEPSRGIPPPATGPSSWTAVLTLLTRPKSSCPPAPCGGCEGCWDTGLVDATPGCEALPLSHTSREVICPRVSALKRVTQGVVLDTSAHASLRMRRRWRVAGVVEGSILTHAQTYPWVRVAQCLVTFLDGSVGC
eukprot:5974571-Amphidinium_carterae.5